MNEIKTYYDQIATEYDKDRFANSYGSFIDVQERTILKQYLEGVENIVDIACGTGRFMEFCATGLDISEAMLAVAAISGTAGPGILVLEDNRCAYFR